MKLLVASTSAGLFLLAASWTASGQAGPNGPGPKGIFQPNPMQSMPRPGAPAPLWNDPQFAERLGLNADQKKRIEAALQEHRLKRVDLNAAMQKAQLLLEPLVKAEQPDENRVLAQIDRVAQAQGEIQKDEMRLQLELRRVLTPQQWRQMEQERPQAGRPGPGPQGPPPTN